MTITDQLLQDMDQGWKRLHSFINSLSEAQITTPTDAAGWTIKDHYIHLSIWEFSMIAVMDGTPRWEAMGVSLDTWRTIVDTYDVINADIQQRYHTMPLDQIRALAERNHQALIARIRQLPPEGLRLPYVHYQPGAVDETDPLLDYLTGNTYDHYDEHLEYMQAILS